MSSMVWGAQIRGLQASGISYLKLSRNLQNQWHVTLSSIYYPRDPSIQTTPTLGPKVYKYYLLWATWIPKVLDYFGVECHGRRTMLSPGSPGVT